MQWLKTFGCGVAVYLVMAACAASDKAGRHQASGGSAAGVPSADGGKVATLGGEPGMASSGEPSMGGIESGMAGMLDPVGGAMAQEPPQPPVVVAKKVTCDKKTLVGGRTQYTYAEADFPGYTKEELARKVSVMTEFNPAAGLGHVEGYDFGLSVPNVKDGAVALLCSPVGANQYYLSVTFQLVE